MVQYLIIRGIMSQKRSNLHKVAIILVLVQFLLMFFVLYTTYAWFTASAQEDNTSSFATLNINIASGSTTMTDSSFQTTYLQNILPGSTINFNNLSVRNSGTASAYTILKLKLKSTDASNSFTFIQYYNLDGERIDNLNLSNNTTSATLLTAGQNRTMNLSYTFNGMEFSNAYKLNTVEVTFTALAIQSSLPDDTTGTYSTDALYAIDFLINEVDTDTDSATYTRLDYIITSGGSNSPYILLDYYANQNTCAEIKYMATSTGGWIFGARAAMNSHAFGLFYSTHTAIWPIWGTQSHSQYAVSNMQNTIQVDTFLYNEFYKNGSLSHTFTASDWTTDQVYSGHQMTLFTLMNGSSPDNRHFGGHFYYLRVWDDEGEQMNLIPVADSSGTICVYDTINEVFYYSENSGTFSYSL